MNASRELDALVAEKVMGWPLVPDGVTATAWPHVRVQDDLMWVFEGMADDWTMYSMRMFCPSEDIDAAWEVVEKMYPEWESGLDSLGYLDGTGIEGKP